MLSLLLVYSPSIWFSGWVGCLVSLLWHVKDLQSSWGSPSYVFSDVVFLDGFGRDGA